MSNTQRPKALANLAPPWTSQVRHLTPAEARDVYQYVVALEAEVANWRQVFETLELLKKHGGQS